MTGRARSTAAWLRNRLRMGAGTAASSVRTARALFRGPLSRTAEALTDGEVSPAHARVLAASTRDLPDHISPWRCATAVLTAVPPHRRHRAAA